ncbi:hypothetical protein D3C76_224400 [compost metagenome]
MAKARKASEQLMREELPYGIHRHANGAKELFNRKYETISSNEIEPDGGEFEELFYYDDSNPPWKNASTQRRCESVLRRHWVTKS